MRPMKRKYNGPTAPYKKRKTFKRRGGSMMIPRGVNMKQAYTTLGYSTAFTLNEATAGVGGVYTFRLNSCYDPDLTGAGFQPVGFDQYALIYQKYLVYGGNWTVSFSSQLAVVNGASVVGAIVTTDATVPSTSRNWPAAVGARSNLLGPGPSSVTTLKGKINMASAFGVKPSAIWNEANFESATGGNPTNQLFMHVFTIGQASTVSYVTVHLKVWMKVRFSGRLNLADS